MSNHRPLEESARGRAVSVLVESYDGDAMCHDLLRDLQAVRPLSPADEGLAAELAIGVSRHRITCEHIASKFYRGRWAGVAITQRVNIAVGIYQLCFLDRIPEYAAVDQAVRIARRYGKGATAVTNAILRQVAENRGDIVARMGDYPPRRFLILDSERGRLFTDDVFPDPSRRLLEYLIAQYAHPSWLVERWNRRFKTALCRDVLEAGQRRPVLSLRANRLRATPADLIEKLAAESISAELASDGNGVLIRKSASAMDLAVVRDGLCQPQDTTARVALGLRPPKPGEFVIDLCAGVGTKSTQAAETMANRGTVISTDDNSEKLESVMTAARRLGIDIIKTVSLDEIDDAIKKAGREPDLILVDAPCLNTGVLARRPEARYRAGQRALAEIAELQREILNHAVSLSGSKTSIVYSTCSLEKEENEDQSAWFAENNDGWKVREQRFTLPTSDHDGGYAVHFIRS